MKAALIVTGIAHMTLAAVALGIAAVGALHARPPVIVAAILMVAAAALVASVASFARIDDPR